MLIITQDNSLVLFENIKKTSIIGIEKQYEITSKIDMYDNICLGVYKTKERALEILKEIEQKYRDILQCNFYGMQEVKFEEPRYTMPKE